MIKLFPYLTSNFLMNFGRVIPQAILTPILLEKGLDFSQIVIVQIAFTITILLFEFPSGILADIFSKAKVYIFSVFLLSISYAVVLLSSGIQMMIVAWVLYGISAAGQSSTMDLYFAEKLRNDESNLKRFYSIDQNTLLISSIISSIVGSFLYGIVGINIYKLSIIAIILSVVNALIFFPKDSFKTKNYAKTTNPLKDILKGVYGSLENWQIKIAVILIIITDIAITAFFNVWQMILINADFSPSYFGIIFIALQLANIVSNIIFSKIKSGNYIYYCCLSGIVIVAAMLLLFDNILLLIPLFFLPLFLFIYVAFLHTRLQKLMPEHLMSSIGSATGTLSALLSLATLGFISLTLQSFSPSTVLSFSLLIFCATSFTFILSARLRREVNI
ncbi:MFS transporter [Rothia sp. P4278]|uniref:MFS transporter n=1 Tax=Rothia sp. P4278 TaxID=3402658 RepID=UPI003AD820F1